MLNRTRLPPSIFSPRPWTTAQPCVWPIRPFRYFKLPKSVVRDGSQTRRLATRPLGLMTAKALGQHRHFIDTRADGPDTQKSDSDSGEKSRLNVANPSDLHAEDSQQVEPDMIPQSSRSALSRNVSSFETLKLAEIALESQRERIQHLELQIGRLQANLKEEKQPSSDGRSRTEALKNDTEKSSDLSRSEKTVDRSIQDELEPLYALFNGSTEPAAGLKQRKVDSLNVVVSRVLELQASLKKQVSHVTRLKTENVSLRGNIKAFVEEHKQLRKEVRHAKRQVDSSKGPGATAFRAQFRAFEMQINALKFSNPDLFEAQKDITKLEHGSTPNPSNMSSESLSKLVITLAEKNTRSEEIQAFLGNHFGDALLLSKIAQRFVTTAAEESCDEANESSSSPETATFGFWLNTLTGSWIDTSSALKQVATKARLRSVDLHSKIAADPHALAIYSDGSMIDRGKLASAAVVPSKAIVAVSSLIGDVESRNPVLATEAEGLYLSLRIADLIAAPRQRVVLFSDCLDLVEMKVRSWLEVSNPEWRLSRIWSLLESLESKNIRPELHWIPRSAGVFGHQMADKFAGKAADALPSGTISVRTRDGTFSSFEDLAASLGHSSTGDTKRGTGLAHENDGSDSRETNNVEDGVEEEEDSDDDEEEEDDEEHGCIADYSEERADREYGKRFTDRSRLSGEAKEGAIGEAEKEEDSDHVESQSIEHIEAGERDTVGVNELSDLAAIDQSDERHKTETIEQIDDSIVSQDVDILTPHQGDGSANIENSSGFEQRDQVSPKLDQDISDAEGSAR